MGKERNIDHMQAKESQTLAVDSWSILSGDCTLAMLPKFSFVYLFVLTAERVQAL